MFHEPRVMTYLNIVVHGIDEPVARDALLIAHHPNILAVPAVRHPKAIRGTFS